VSPFRRSNRYRPDVDVVEWKGSYYPYDIIKEGAIALLVVVVLVVGLAFVFGSPDVKQVTLRQWSRSDPIDFAQTALSELNGTSITATYGAPYNNASTGQQLGPLSLAKWMGVHSPIDAAQDFVLQPLTEVLNQPTLTTDLATWRDATSAQRNQWLTNYANAATNMKYVNGHIVTAATNAGPVPLFIDELTNIARTGALDQELISGKGFYSMNYTKPLMFLADSGWLSNQGAHWHLGGDEWGMMNETGSYPGQAWLWLYTFWYQIPPYSTSGNGDVLVWGTMMVLTLGLLLIPFIPGLRSIPRWSRVYRIIWRDYYKSHGA